MHAAARICAYAYCNMHVANKRLSAKTLFHPEKDFDVSGKELARGRQASLGVSI